MKLELNHLSEYLPYSLQIQSEDKSDTTILNGKMLTDKYWYRYFEVLKYRPILKPISDLLKDKIANYDLLGGHRNWTFYGEDWVQFKGCQLWSYMDVKTLIEHKFDVFNLIENGLAIDVNTLK
jgi:hypothetical protein